MVRRVGGEGQTLADTAKARTVLLPTTNLVISTKSTSQHRGVPHSSQLHRDEPGFPDELVRWGGCVGYSRKSGVPGELCSLGWEGANLSPFCYQNLVISTEGVAEVEKPALCLSSRQIFEKETLSPLRLSENLRKPILYIDIGPRH